jgi:hypothetical protein
MTSNNNASILWRRLDMEGHDACRLVGLDGGWRVEGVAAFVHRGEPCGLAYAVECDADWRTRAAEVTGSLNGEPIDLRIARSESGEWRMNGIAQPNARGLVDVDLGFTPATNLIAIRRLNLAPGEGSPAPAAYVAFPELRFERLEQTYVRLDAGRYRYKATAYEYDEVLSVSSIGFVTTYPRLWEVVSQHGGG